MAILIALVLVLAGCGDPLVGERYRGEALFVVAGQVQNNNEDLNFPVEVRLAVFWNQDLSGTALMEQPATATDVMNPSQYELVLVETPRASERLNGGALAVGFIGAYEDTDGDGRKSDAESFLGLAIPALIWAETPLSALETPFPVPIEAGFQVVGMPLLCDAPTPPLPTGGVCDSVPLHAPCQSNADCTDAGFCLANLNDAWPRGACGVAEDNANGCRPSNSIYYRPRPEDRAPGAGPGYFIQACTVDSDCLREGDARPYRCDPGLGGCVPRRDARVLLRSDAEPQELCVGGMMEPGDRPMPPPPPPR
ncbi:MAG: hypothetical protein AAF654_01955 [Myxococcota bacterium]